MTSKEKSAARARAWYWRNREKALASIKAWREQNREKMRAASDRWKANNPDRVLAQNRKKRNVDKKKARIRQLRYDTKQAKTNPLFRLRKSVRCRIREAVRRRGLLKSKSTWAILGCSFEQLQRHIESQFLDGMTWENRGPVWHIDHIIPLAAGKTRSEIEALCHYKNLRPLWALENHKKGAKILNRPLQNPSTTEGAIPA